MSFVSGDWRQERGKYTSEEERGSFEDHSDPVCDIREARHSQSEERHAVSLHLAVSSDRVGCLCRTG